MNLNNFANYIGKKIPLTKSTLAMLKKCRERCLSALKANCFGIRQNIKNYASIMTDGQEKRKYWLMTLDCGIAQIEKEMIW